ncbi:VOC family protein [Streptomyces sp. SID5785]|uniref:VOC family protein n=1 Tax=Streptomyces sp. SID5785 TaxID=2690309 RepID=UPI001361D76A|nr:VOC family protein [Streptomyces sp. SID5785]MZD10307.1 VOC family protein [Streptomyces sp. SID5785]
MKLSLTSVVVDAADLEGEGLFWHGLLGGTLSRIPTHRFVQADGLPVLVVQHAPEHTPPHQPDGSPQQMHIDLATDDLLAADRRVLEAGGRRLRPADGPTGADAEGSRVYASPAGHPFCIRAVRPATQ